MLARFKPRRWFRYSLRTFLFLVTVLCILLGVYMQQKWDKQLAIQTIIGWGGTIHFDYEPSVAERAQRAFLSMESAFRGTPAPVFVDRPPPGPQWLRRYVGDHFFAAAVEVELPYLGDEIKLSWLGDKKVDFGALAPLTKLRSLTIRQTKNLDNELRHLEKLPELEVLRLSLSNVTDRGLTHIARLPNLKILSLANTQVTDIGVLQLSSLHELRHLEIKNTGVTDAGADRLRRALPNCEVIK
ncbi:MAG: leucine-rich repeat domain-containing protein [Pirellulales bacterium]